jgi:hypothetical protein
MKTKDAVWVVSNCNTPSKREKYVKEMQNIINVDIFGRCGKPCNQICLSTAFVYNIPMCDEAPLEIQKPISDWLSSWVI